MSDQKKPSQNPRQDHHKESALGWLQNASDVAGKVHVDSPHSAQQMIDVATVHALLYIGDQVGRLADGRGRIRPTGGLPMGGVTITQSQPPPAGAAGVAIRREAAERRREQA